jgi:hypothetical protein
MSGAFRNPVELRDGLQFAFAPIALLIHRAELPDFAGEASGLRLGVDPHSLTASVTLRQPVTSADVNKPGTLMKPMASRLTHLPSVRIKPALARWQ